MLKQRFLKNSTKLLIVSVFLLLFSNVIEVVGIISPSFNEKIGFLQETPQIALFVFPLLSYLALNDEKAAHRKIKDIESQKKVRILKAFLVSLFVFSFLKPYVMKLLTGNKGVFSSLLLSAILVVSSYSFFMLVLSLWYFVRERKEKRLKVAPLISVVVSAVYAFFKFFWYLLYQYTVFDFPFTLHFKCESYIINAISVVQYTVNIMAFLVLMKHYEKKENELAEKEKQKIPIERPEVYECINSDKGYGIDVIDDIKNMFVSE